MWSYVMALALAVALTLSSQPASAESVRASASDEGTATASPQPASPEVAGKSGSDEAHSASISEDMSVIDLALAGDVQDREPVGPVEPSVSCEKDKTASQPLPVVDSTTSERIFFWNRVKSSVEGTLRHTWMMKRDQGWEPMAKVELRIGESPAYRVWSSKQLDRTLHLGEWMVEVSSAEDPGQVLCLIRFQVE